MNGEYFIFKESAVNVFYGKLEDVHEIFTATAVMFGSASIGTRIEDIKLSVSPPFQSNRKVCGKVVGSLMNTQPMITAHLIEKSFVAVECLFFQLTGNSFKSEIFLVQNIIDWPVESFFTCEVFILKGLEMEPIKELWNK